MSEIDKARERYEHVCADIPIPTACLVYIRTLEEEITRLQAENEERRKAQPYVYIGKDGKSVLARDLEDRLLKAEAELSSLKACDETDTDRRPRYSMKRMRDEIAKAKAYARAEALEAGAKEAEAQNCHAVVAAISRLKEGA